MPITKKRYFVMVVSFAMVVLGMVNVMLSGVDKTDDVQDDEPRFPSCIVGHEEINSGWELVILGTIVGLVTFCWNGPIMVESNTQTQKNDFQTDDDFDDGL